MQVVNKLVRNFTPGRQGYKPEAIVIHTADGQLAGAYSWFNNPASRASAHYMIGKSGIVWKFVEEQNTAWHAGGINKPTWSLIKGTTNPNLYTIGIEHEGFSGETWPTSMLTSSAELVAMLCQKWGIPADARHIIGHNQINSVTRARCPGTGVNLNNLLKLVNSYFEDPQMIKELQERIKALEAAQADLANQNSNLQLENASLKLQIDQLKKQLSEQGKDVELLQQVRNLTTEVYTLQQTRDKLFKRVQELESQLLSNKGDIDLNQFSVTELLQAAWRKMRGGS